MPAPGRPKSTLSKEEKLARKREAERERRARRKADVELQKEDQLKERLRYLGRKKEGKIKMVKDLTPRELRQRRKKVRENVRRFREKNRILARTLANTPPQSPMVGNDVVRPQPGRSRREAGLRRIRRERSKLYRQMAKLKETIETTTKAKDMYRKRYERLIKKLKKQDLLSPKSKVKHLLQRKTPENEKEVKRRLFLGEVMQRQLSASFAQTKHTRSHRQIFVKALGGDVLHKYRVMMHAEEFFSQRIYKSNRRRNCKTLRYEKNLKQKALEQQNKIRKFLMDDQRSSPCPGKKQFKIFNGKKVKIRYLNNTMQVLYDRFSKTVSKKLSYATFCRFRPPHVVAPKLDGRDSCMCIKHENMKLLTFQLHQAGIIPTRNPDSLIKTLGCATMGEKCYLRKCHVCTSNVIAFQPFDNSTPFSYNMWTTKFEERKIKGTQRLVKRTVKEKIQSSLLDGVRKLESEINETHSCNTPPTQGIRILKQRPRNEMVVHIDFSENCACKYFEEPQAIHFGASRQQLSLHTGVAYCGTEIASFATVSSNLRHDAKAVLAHLVPTLKYLFERFNDNTPNVLNFISDGPSSQYRNRTMFTIIGKFIPQFFPNITAISWNYSETGHGKGPADGIGGCLKRTADRIVALGNDISDLDSFVNALRKEVSAIKLLVINNSDIKMIDDKVTPSTLIDTVKSTMKVHQCTWTKHSSTLQFRSLSCTECTPGMDCVHYPLGSTTLKVHPSQPVTRFFPAEPQPGQNDTPTRSAVSPRVGSSLFQTSITQPGTWVAVQYERNWYPGVVEKVRDDMLLVNFMARTAGNNGFFWPDIADRQEVDKNGVLYVLKSPPQPISRRHMSIEEAKYIDFLSTSCF